MKACEDGKMSTLGRVGRGKRVEGTVRGGGREGGGGNENGGNGINPRDDFFFPGTCSKNARFLSKVSIKSRDPLECRVRVHGQESVI